jgi:hypothetical protein
MEREQTKTLRLLVVDNTPRYLQTAGHVYTNISAYTDPDLLFGNEPRRSRPGLIPGIKASYARDLPEALKLLNEGDFDGVVTDLFFPSEEGTDLRQYYAERADDEDARQEILELEEEPSGLRLAERLHDRGIPFKILSQGDRHRGDFGRIRRASINHPHLTPIFGNDPIARIAYQREDKPVDKTNPGTWIWVLSDEDNGLVRNINGFNPDDYSALKMVQVAERELDKFLNQRK